MLLLKTLLINTNTLRFSALLVKNQAAAKMGAANEAKYLRGKKNVMPAAVKN
jgi:hypothetical protein